MIQLNPRDYQKSIVETCKENNTLVVLPTGLGKTLIALMLAIERIKQFPGSKILFLAPTRPLVEQHFETFKTQLPELYAQLDIFTGSVDAKTRKKIFQTAEIIFSTPQCIANDLEHYLYNTNDVSLLIIDEAHRCLKNYDYTKVVKKYKEQSHHPKILGLTASPGHDPDKVKEICAHLDIEEIEIRTRDSPDVKPYLQDREFETINVDFPKEFAEIKVLLKRIFDSKVEQLQSRHLLFSPANKITLLKLQNNLAKQTGGGNWNAMMGMSLTAQAIKISHAQELLETQTLSGLEVYLKGLQKQAEEKKSKGVQTLVNSPEFQAALLSLKHLREKNIEHPKIQKIFDIIEEEIKINQKAKIIIFTQFRETAQTIATKLKEIKNINASIFIGQAKKNDVGFSQKEQKEVIEKFRSGEINVICATSIGEEGLDIPEVSAVIFYEPVPSAIRKIQRCLPKDSQILISNGTYKKIEDINIGDKIISYNLKNKNFEHKEVIDKFSNGKKRLIRLNTEKNDSLVVTENHPILTPNGWKKADEIVLKDKVALAKEYPTNNNKRFFYEILPEDTYICNNELLKNILIKSKLTYKKVALDSGLNKKTLWSYANRDAIPLNEFKSLIMKLDKENYIETLRKISVVKSRKGNRITIPETINSDFMWAIGFLASDGDFRIEKRTRKNKKTSEITYKFRFSNTNKTLLDKAKKILSNFGLKSYEDYKRYTIEANNTVLGKIIHNFGLPFGKKSKTLKLTDEIFRLDNEAIKGFLAGYYDGDGSFDKKTGHVRIGTGSEELAKQLHILLLRIGILSTTVIINKNEIRNIKGKVVSFTGNFYSVEIYRKEDSQKILDFKELIKTKYKLSYKFTKNNEKSTFWVRIKSIEDYKEEETYNLEVADNNTFVANNIIVHNSGRTARLKPGKIIILITSDTRDVAHHYASAARERKMYKVLEEVKKNLKTQKSRPTLDKF